MKAMKKAMMPKMSMGGGVKSGMNAKATVVKKATPANRAMNSGKAMVKPSKKMGGKC